MEKFIRQFKSVIKENPSDVFIIKQTLDELSHQVESPFFLLETILESLQSKNLSLEVRIFLLEKAGEICEKLYEFKKAIEIYKNLIFLLPKKEYREKLERLKKLQILERVKEVLRKYAVPLEVAEQILKESEETNRSFEVILMERFKIPKEEILQAVKSYYKIPAFDIKDFKKFKKLPQVITIKQQFFEEHLCVPFEYQKTIYLVCYYPENTESIETVKKVLQIPATETTVAFALKEDILEAINVYFKQASFYEMEAELEMVEEEEEEEVEDLTVIDSAVVQLVNNIIEEAYRMRASDIHWESLPGKKGLQIRFRVDGECFHFTTLPESQKRPVISRIKIMANLDIAERRLPQDGKIKFRTREGKHFEIRVATLPTIEGNEDVVMRILGGMEFRTLEEIDLLPENYENFKKILDLPYGLILVVGPTGSGKTTTLHAALKYLNKPNKKIWTAEDPVEIVQDGLRQVQVNPKIGLTFARVLRAFLRADPDIIMIGETRDEETAHTLIEASLTGHLVLSTLHTNSAPETITRLLGMGMDPFNFADALLGVLAQRLAKRLCPHCKKPYTPSEEELQRIKREYGFHPLKPLTEEMFKKATFYKPSGCSKCNYTGFKGRIAIHELLVPDEELKKLIIENAPAQKIREVAINKGFTTLKQDGILKVLKGETTLKQILAVTVR